MELPSAVSIAAVKHGETIQPSECDNHHYCLSTMTDTETDADLRIERTRHSAFLNDGARFTVISVWQYIRLLLTNHKRDKLHDGDCPACDKYYSNKRKTEEITAEFTVIVAQQRLSKAHLRLKMMYY